MKISLSMFVRDILPAAEMKVFLQKASLPECDLRINMEEPDSIEFFVKQNASNSVSVPGDRFFIQCKTLEKWPYQLTKEQACLIEARFGFPPRVELNVYSMTGSSMVLTWGELLSKNLARQFKGYWVSPERESFSKAIAGIKGVIWKPKVLEIPQTSGTIYVIDVSFSPPPVVF